MPYRVGRNDPLYNASRAELKKWDHVCHLCGVPIDMQLRYPHPLSWSCDHKVPLDALPLDDPRRWHISNLQAAHLRCNEARGAKRVGRPPRLDW